jgi:hypothetical protein
MVTIYEVRDDQNRLSATSSYRKDAIREADDLRQTTGKPHYVYEVESRMIWEGQSVSERAQEEAYFKAARAK